MKSHEAAYCLTCEHGRQSEDGLSRIDDRLACSPDQQQLHAQLVLADGELPPGLERPLGAREELERHQGPLT